MKTRIYSLVLQIIILWGIYCFVPEIVDNKFGLFFVGIFGASFIINIFFVIGGVPLTLPKIKIQIK